ncbi:MAG: CPBP family intramembrane metalloprotease [Acidobacteria bacterium]|nr:CPBP family intramembrane metalloprotease [Acidobacteriota bacterium]
MHEETPRSRFVVLIVALIEPLVVTLLAIVVSMPLFAIGLFATALLVENDSLLGMERKLDVWLTPSDGEAPPALEETRSSIESTFERVDVIIVPEGETAWRLFAWIEGDPSGEQLAGVAARLDELGWDDVVPKLTSQRRFVGMLENPRQIRAYLPVPMTLQMFVFIVSAWMMIRWRKPPAFDVVAPPATALAWGIGAAVTAFFASMLLAYASHLAGLDVKEQPWITALMADRSTLWFFTPWLVLLGPISEEVFFRGYVFRRLFSTAGPVAAYATSALLFAVIHLYPVGIPMYAVIGLVFCWVYRKTGSLWAPVIGHVVYNAIGVGIPLLAPPTP